MTRYAPTEAVPQASDVEEPFDWLDSYDPTPWCLGCGARTKVECDCGPIAKNE